jgi:ATP-dependent phosphoenolpyruvate carboxykinase
MDTQEFFEIVDDDHEEYKSVTSEKIVEQTRWSVYKTSVVEHIKTGKLFIVNWGVGATEYQEGQDEPWSMIEAESYQVTVVKHKPIIGGMRYESE